MESTQSPPSADVMLAGKVRIVTSVWSTTTVPMMAIRQALISQLPNASNLVSADAKKVM